MTCPAEIPRWKRTLDVVLVLLTLPLVLPLAILVGVLIRMVSEGPVLFRQERVGFLGRNSCASNSGRCLSAPKRPPIRDISSF